MKLVIATKNINKTNEIKEIFADFKNLDIISLNDFQNVPDIEEDGHSFEENALKKAKAYCSFTGLPVLSDDSGLEVDNLSGEPGVRSARYAGQNASDDENNNLLLMRLKDVPDDKRSARFVCVIALVLPDGNKYLARGTCEGRITNKKSGGNGFGYDPVFYIPGIKKTMAELSIQEKNKISHRAKALGKAKEILLNLFLPGK